MQCVKNKDKIMKIEEKKLPKIIECKYHKNSLYDNAQFHCWTTTKFLERSDLKCLPNILYSGACQIKLYQSVTMATAAVNFYFLCYLSLGYRVLFMNTLHLDPKALIQKFAAKWSRALNQERRIKNEFSFSNHKFLPFWSDESNKASPTTLALTFSVTDEKWIFPCMHFDSFIIMTIVCSWTVLCWKTIFVCTHFTF